MENNRTHHGTEANNVAGDAQVTHSERCVMDRNSNSSSAMVDSFDECLACLICRLPEAQHSEALSRLNEPSLRQLVLSHKPCKTTYDVRAEYLPKARLYGITNQRTEFHDNTQSAADEEVSFINAQAKSQIHRSENHTLVHQNSVDQFEEQNAVELSSNGAELEGSAFKNFRRSEEEEEEDRTVMSAMAPKERIKFCEDDHVIGFDGGKEHFENENPSRESSTDFDDFRYSRFGKLHDQMARNLSSGTIDTVELLLDPVTQSNTLFNAQRENFGDKDTAATSDDGLLQIYCQPPEIKPLLPPKPSLKPKPQTNIDQDDSNDEQLRSNGQSLTIRLDPMDESPRAARKDGGFSPLPASTYIHEDVDRKYKSKCCTLIRIGDHSRMSTNETTIPPQSQVPPLVRITNDDMLMENISDKQRRAPLMRNHSIIGATGIQEGISQCSINVQSFNFSTNAGNDSGSSSHNVSNCGDQANATHSQSPSCGANPVFPPRKSVQISPNGSNNPREEQTVTVDMSVAVCSHLPRDPKRLPENKLINDRHYRDYSPKKLYKNSAHRRFERIKKIFGQNRDSSERNEEEAVVDSYRSAKFLTPPAPSLCSLSPGSFRKAKNHHLFHADDDKCHLDDDDLYLSPTVVVNELAEISRQPSSLGSKNFHLDKDLDGSTIWQSLSFSSGENESCSSGVKPMITPLDSFEVVENVKKQSSRALSQAYADVEEQAPDVQFVLEPEGASGVKEESNEKIERHSPSVDSWTSWVTQNTTSSNACGNSGDLAAMHTETLAYIAARLPTCAEFWKRVLGLDSNLTSLGWKNIAILSESPVLATDYALFFAAALRIEKSESPAKIIVAISQLESNHFGYSVQKFEVPCLGKFHDYVPMRFALSSHSKDSSVEGMTAEKEKKMLCKICVLPRLLVMTLPMWESNFGQLPAGETSAQEQRMCFVLLQILDILKNLQIEGVEELPNDLCYFLIISSNCNSEKWPRVCFLPEAVDRESAFSEGGTNASCVSLNQIGVLVIGCLLHGYSGLRGAPSQLPSVQKTTFAGLFGRVAKVLDEAKTSSLSKAKYLLEAAFWLQDTEFTNPQSHESETSTEAVRSWIEKERALKVGSMVKLMFDEKEFPDVRNEQHIQFLLHASAKRLAEACGHLRHVNDMTNSSQYVV